MLEEMSAFFNERANRYNVAHIELVDGGMESKQILASYLPGCTETLIDLGIGTGLELKEIFKRFPNIKVTGLDVAENMLRLLKESYPDKNITLHCENYLNFDLGISRYDAALSVMTLHHYDHETKTALYRKIHNCIKKDGVYIECDYMLSEHEHGDAQAREDSFFSEYQKLKNEQGITDDYEYHFDTPCTVSNQMKMLLDAGFSSVREGWRRKNTVILIANRA